MEVQGIRFVGFTREVCHPPPLYNLQNLRLVPSYFRIFWNKYDTSESG